jgi:hypothetical protein
MLIPRMNETTYDAAHRECDHPNQVCKVYGITPTMEEEDVD